MQQPVGECVPAFKVSGQLHLVDRDKFHICDRRHGFNGADMEPGTLGANLLFARYESHGSLSDLVDNTIIDFAGQQAQRQAYHSRFVRNHALNRQMRFAGIGWPQHGGYATTATGGQLSCLEFWMGVKVHNREGVA